jgi:molybdate transport repressor ModE-like protein
MRVELRLGGLITANGQPVPLGKTAALLDAVARAGSFPAAAALLGVTARAASSRARRLEAAFGRPLVVRAGRGARLTPEGEAVRAALAATLDAFATGIVEEEARLAGALARACPLSGT